MPKQVNTKKNSKKVSKKSSFTGSRQIGHSKSKKHNYESSSEINTTEEFKAILGSEQSVHSSFNNQNNMMQMNQSMMPNMMAMNQQPMSDMPNMMSMNQSMMPNMMAMNQPGMMPNMMGMNPQMTGMNSNINSFDVDAAMINTLAPVGNQMNDMDYQNLMSGAQMAQQFSGMNFGNLAKLGQNNTMQMPNMSETLQMSANMGMNMQQPMMSNAMQLNAMNSMPNMPNQFLNQSGNSTFKNLASLSHIKSI